MTRQKVLHTEDGVLTGRRPLYRKDAQDAATNAAANVTKENEETKDSRPLPSDGRGSKRKLWLHLRPMRGCSPSTAISSSPRLAPPSSFPNASMALLQANDESNTRLPGSTGQSRMQSVRAGPGAFSTFCFLFPHRASMALLHGACEQTPGCQCRPNR